VRRGQEIAPEEYCLAEHWEHAGSGGHAGEELKDFLGTVALSCDQCMEEVCSYNSLCSLSTYFRCFAFMYGLFLSI